MPVAAPAPPRGKFQLWIHTYKVPGIKNSDADYESSIQNIAAINPMNILQCRKSANLIHLQKYQSLRTVLGIFQATIGNNNYY